MLLMVSLKYQLLMKKIIQQMLMMAKMEGQLLSRKLIQEMLLMTNLKYKLLLRKLIQEMLLMTNLKYKLLLRKLIQEMLLANLKHKQLKKFILLALKVQYGSHQELSLTLNQKIMKSISVILLWHGSQTLILMLGLMVTK